MISDPELTKKEIKEHDKFVCICSDGVWEFLTNQAVCDIVGRFDVPLDACRATVAEAYRLWLQFDVRTDDITMLLAFIDYSKISSKKLEKAESRGSIRGSISIGGDMLKKGGGSRPVRRGLSKEKRAAIATLAADMDSSVKMEELPMEAKSDAELGRLRTALNTNYLFSVLTDEQKDKVRRMRISLPERPFCAPLTTLGTRRRHMRRCDDWRRSRGRPSTR